VAVNDGARDVDQLAVCGTGMAAEHVEAILALVRDQNAQMLGLALGHLRFPDGPVYPSRGPFDTGVQWC